MPYSNRTLLRWLSIWPVLAFLEVHAQLPYQVVPLTAEVSSVPPSITVKWPFNSNADFYKVKRKQLNETVWQELATLPGAAIQFSDLDVAVGDAWEYSVVRSGSLPTIDTVCVAPGTMVTFTIHDTGGNGLCCWNSDGYWQVYACGELIAEGARYEYQDQHQFTMCGSAACEEVIIHVYPDHDFQEVSWELTSSEGSLLGYGNPEMAPMFGYILAGIEVAPIEQQGTILLLVDQQHAEPLSMELARLSRDLIGEGWLVVRQDVDANMPVTKVKDIILSAEQSVADLTTVFLIGQIPIPYSGMIAPDGHEDHIGAWPADLYYAELDGVWTDEEVTWIPWSVNPRNHNIPGDGKLDQSTLLSDVDLMIGRVDLSDLPVYQVNELELLRAYLDRDHTFRTGALTFQRKAVIDEHFLGLDHESAVYRSCIPMFGTENVYVAPFINTLAAESHLWSMAGGPGTFNSANGVGNSADVAATPLNGAFVHLLGSYFGDWDISDNFMRSVLASGTMLGAVWGLQEIVFHHMALGLPIGECVRRSQNARYDIYERQGRSVYMALMGDPTLQLLPAPQVGSLQLNTTNEGVELFWSAVEGGNVLGYHIYRRTDATQHFMRVNNEPVVTTSYFDQDAPSGMVEYMVRSLKLEQTESGTYHVLGTGPLETVSISVGLDAHDQDAITIYPNPGKGIFSIRMKDLSPTMDIRLFDMAGEQVDSWTSGNAGEFTLITDAVPGLYLLRIVDPAGDTIQRKVGIVH